ncbi:futalosine hydrolase [Mucilaginibacter phyllosphaerae]|uniref:Futalosine hydrolase n=1 Tax=Mucilaginibacter phyllosphaerae TaxID=1812349 RepID=A0A4Y8AG58_9SPHI|nr:futalosine hydrolase [Mucilaginibacter phyllosphaerae]MBB3970269.1 futalosine hydrolase [Mucilaginibacter phyllosphaerae]TEW66979.1 futalosine hydrolase [Mucilaginibacter phyllosphaerae]GGH10944.1 Futalosine hydrolase [Mucilaginibacter phyllosphaerae]
MRILFVAATEFEVESLKFKVENQIKAPDFKPSTLNSKLLITGVGMVATAFSLGRELANNQYDLAINLGIAGSFDRSFALGGLVEITEDTLAELGAEDDETFLPITQMGFGESVFKATKPLADIYKTANLKQATAITVNTVHGNSASIKKVQARLGAQIESMEGAAFFYACREAGVPCMQIRAVSNYVEKRNRDAWQIGLAVKNLNTFAGELVERLKVGML